MKLKKILSLLMAITLMSVAVISMNSCDVEDISEIFNLEDEEDIGGYLSSVLGGGMDNETEPEVFGEPLESLPKIVLAEDYEMLISTIEKNIELKINMGETKDAELERFRLASFKSYYGRFDLNEAINPEMRDRLLTDYPILQVTGVIYVLDPAISPEQLPLQAAFMSEYVPAANKFVAKCYNNVEEAVRNSNADNKEELMTYVQNVIR